MFDLDQHILQWRQTAAGALGNKPEVIDELESHLRDDMQRLVQTGQPPEVAWETAVARLGAPRQLAAEFAKVPATAGSWLPARSIPLAVFALATGLVALAAATYTPAPVRADLPPRPVGMLLVSHILAITVGYVTTLAIGALAAWSILTRAISGWDARRATALRSAVWKLTVAGLVLTALGFVLGGVWAQDNLGHFWGWDPREIGGVCVVVWYCLMLLCLRFSTPGGMEEMVMGVAGNVVVSMSWFGVVFLFPQHQPIAERIHSYGFSWQPLSLVAGFVVVQLAMLGIAMAGPGRLGRKRA